MFMNISFTYQVRLVHVKVDILNGKVVLLLKVHNNFQYFSDACVELSMKECP